MKQAALLQRCRMAPRSAVKQLQRGWLQQSQILAVLRCRVKPDDSNKQPLHSGAENSPKRE